MATLAALVSDLALKHELEWIETEMLEMEERAKRHAERKSKIISEIERRANDPSRQRAASSATAQGLKVSAMKEKSKKDDENASDTEWVALKRPGEGSGENGPEHDWGGQSW